MALDSGIAKMGIFAFSFLVFFGLFIALIPSDFGYTGRTYAQPQNKIEDWKGMDLMRYNFTETWNTTLVYGVGGNTYNFPVGGRNLYFKSYFSAYENYIRLAHRYGFGLLWYEYMDWYDENEVLRSFQQSGVATITTNELDADFITFGNLEYGVICKGAGSGSSYFQVTAIFSFNTTLYASPSNAYYNDALDILIGINPVNINVNFDIWGLITSLLTFNTVQVFGSSGTEVLLLNMAIVAPFWAAIIIFAAAILLELIPF